MDNRLALPYFFDFRGKASIPVLPKLTRCPENVIFPSDAGFQKGGNGGEKYAGCKENSIVHSPAHEKSSYLLVHQFPGE